MVYGNPDKARAVLVAKGKTGTNTERKSVASNVSYVRKK
ncbi:hypothetical protein A1F99_139100 [Pyrenophora tritici-repentis]|nr:hypothetical protein A1F99_139100 [Pyrenophora tritici-repentis]